MIVGDVDHAGRGLAEQAGLKIEMVPGPLILQHHEFLAEARAHIAETGLQTPDGLLLAELVGDGDDDRLGHFDLDLSW